MIADIILRYFIFGHTHLDAGPVGGPCVFEINRPTALGASPDQPTYASSMYQANEIYVTEIKYTYGKIAFKFGLNDSYNLRDS